MKQQNAQNGMRSSALSNDSSLVGSGNLSPGMVSELTPAVIYATTGGTQLMLGGGDGMPHHHPGSFFDRKYLSSTFWENFRESSPMVVHAIHNFIQHKFNNHNSTHQPVQPPLQ
jgi:hypothetical protein